MVHNQNTVLGTARREKKRKNIHADPFKNPLLVRFGMSAGQSLSTETATSSCPTSDRPALQILEHELNQLIRKMTGESDDILNQKKHKFSSSKTTDFQSTRSNPFKKKLQQTSWEQQLSGNACSLDHKSKNGDGNNPASLEGKTSSNKVVPALSSGLHSWGRRKQIYTIQMTSYLPTHAPSLSTGHMTSLLYKALTQPTLSMLRLSSTVLHEEGRAEKKQHCSHFMERHLAAINGLFGVSNAVPQSITLVILQRFLTRMRSNT